MEANQPHITNLLDRCKKSDSKAQLEIYNCYYRAMYNSAHRILKDDFEAEDIMQEAFLTAFTKLKMYKGEVAFGAWLKRIVINKSLTQLKKNKRYNDVKMKLIINEEVDVEEEELDFSGLQAKQVIEALNRLKENYRVVLTLHFIEGYDYDEISEIVNISNENVRTIMSRAKKKIKYLLLEEPELRTYEK